MWSRAWEGLRTLRLKSKAWDSDLTVLISPPSCEGGEIGTCNFQLSTCTNELGRSAKPRIRQGIRVTAAASDGDKHGWDEESVYQYRRTHPHLMVIVIWLIHATFVKCMSLFHIARGPRYQSYMAGKHNHQGPLTWHIGASTLSCSHCRSLGVTSRSGWTHSQLNNRS